MSKVYIEKGCDKKYSEKEFEQLKKELFDEIVLSNVLDEFDEKEYFYNMSKFEQNQVIKNFLTHAEKDMLEILEDWLGDYDCVEEIVT